MWKVHKDAEDEKDERLDNEFKRRKKHKKVKFWNAFLQSCLQNLLEDGIFFG